MDVSLLLHLILASAKSNFYHALPQPNFVQGMHNLLVQLTSNDTTQLKAVRLFRIPECSVVT
jgi:hypothetical protein